RGGTLQNGDGPGAYYQRAAELFCGIAKALPGMEAVPYLESALERVPSMLEALSLLEQIALETDQRGLLPPRWRAFIESAPDSPAVDRRRALLAKAYAASGQIEAAIECLRPLAAKGEAKAQKAIEQLEERLSRLKSIFPKNADARGGPIPRG